MLKPKLLASAVVLGLMATSATAASLNVTTQSGTSWPFPDASGQNSWWHSVSYETGPVASPIQRGPVAAGVFRLFGQDANDPNAPLNEFLAFCMQPFETLSLPKVYEMTTTLGQSALDNLDALGANAWLSINNSDTAAAFQMAVWELANDDGDFDIDGGNFRITSAPSAAVDLAQTWLDRIAGVGPDPQWMANGQSFMVLSATGTQDLFTNMGGSNVTGEVPLPASGLLLIGGLAGAGAMARRKARKAA